VNEYHTGGWRIDLERFDVLAALPAEDPVLAMRGTYNEVSVDPRSVLRVENQGSVGSCQGHSISSSCEWCYVIATRDEDLQLSRAYGYYETQRLDQISGDRGSTIEGGIRLATEFGICREELWPYSGRYEPTRPRPIEELRKDAATYKIGKSYKLTSYDGIRTFLGSGQGAVHLGITWNSSVDAAVVNNYSGAQGGGHAISLYSLSERKDSQGRPYCWMMNSWGKGWGNTGWAEWSPTAISQMLSSRWAVFVGVSDMPNVKPREFTLADLKKSLRI
jgi:C1A family cysteine protease